MSSATCLFPVANGALFVKKKLRFKVRVSYSGICVLASSFKDVIDLLCSNADSGRHNDMLMR